MARCGCSGGTCSCVVTGTGQISVTGTGTTSNPYVISGGGVTTVQDTSTINLTLTGTGSGVNPYVISGVAEVSLDELTDVVATGGSTGYVLAKQGDGSFALNPPSTASPGTIVVSGGIEGDGSAGSPLSIKLATDSGLVEDSSGLRVSGGGGAWTAWTPTITASTINPTIGNGTIGGRYIQFGKTVHFRMWYVHGTTSQRGSGYWSFSLPVQGFATGSYGQDTFVAELSCYNISDSPGVAMLGPAGSASIIERIWFTNGLTGHAITGGWPTQFPAGSEIHISGTYEAM